MFLFNKYWANKKNITSSLGCNAIEDISHIYACNKVDNINTFSPNINVNDIFNTDTSNINNITEIITNLMETRSKKIENMESTE